jgi:plastocyanin
LIVLGVALGVAVPAHAGNIAEIVEVGDNFFDPDTVAGAHPGEAVRWDWVGTSATHNVRQVRGLFRSPLSNEPGTMYTRTFSAGTFPYECEIHAPFMAGTVKVQVWQGATPSGLPLIKWAFPNSDTGNAFDVQFRVGDGRWRPWRTDTLKLQGAFGRNDRPVRFNPAREYWFRARSQKGVNTPAKISGWSPATEYD